jgi:hypothetical protein
LKVTPFYSGADSYPFSCLRATQMKMDPPVKRKGVPFSSINEFYLSEES